jgi:hypothetical protein
VAEFLLGVLGNLLAAEIGEWLPKLSLQILKCSLSKIPPELSDRLSEEWRAVLVDTPGGVSKIRCAIGFLLATPRVRHEFYLPDEPFSPIAFRIIRARDVSVSTVMLFLLAPVLFALAILIRITSMGPVLDFDIRLRNNGTPFRLYKLRTTVAFGEPNELKLTPIGLFLKQTELYLLPNLYNVLIGDLALAGKKPKSMP